MSSLKNSASNDDLDELTAMLRLLNDPEAAVANSAIGNEIDDLLVGFSEDTAKSVSDVVDSILETKDGGDLTEVFEKLEQEHKAMKMVDVEAMQNESDSPIPQSTPFSAAQVVVKKGKQETENKLSPRQTKVDMYKTERSMTKSRFNLKDKGDDFFAATGLEREIFFEALDKAPVKAKDKISNLLNWFNGGPDISIYTVIALRHLIDTKEATSNSIKLALMSYPEKPYPLSTASTQAGQMMAVFPVTRIATRDGGRLLLIEESPIVRKFIAEYSIG